MSMIDCVTMYLNNIEAPVEVGQRGESKITFCGLTFYPKYNSDGEVRCYEGNWNELRLKLTENTLHISNSLHKFLKENNYSDFSYTELLQAVKLICTRFNTAPEEIKVTSFEYGYNVNVNTLPEEYYECVRNFDKKPLEVMRSRKAQVYGTKAALTQYEVKIYDKTKEQKISNNNIPYNTLRVELKIKTLQKAPFIKSLADLTNKDNIQHLQRILTQSIKKFTVSRDYSKLRSPRQREFAYAGESPDYWRLEKKLNKNTAKKKRKDYNALMESLKEKSIINELIDMLDNKYKFLINS